MTRPGIETVGYFAVFFGIVRNLGVEEEQWESPHVDLPDPGPYLTSGERDTHHHSCVGGSDTLGIDDVVALDLAAEADLLSEDTLAIEQTDSGKGCAEVAGTLEMVSGEHAQPTGVLGEQGSEPELGGAVGDRGGDAVLDQICLGYDPTSEVGITGERLDLRLPETGDDRGRMRVQIGPRKRIE
jgi:hypothetical protein